MAEARIDKWMWAVRIFKTRTIAAEACKKGRISINGALAKAARTVKPGDVIQVRKAVREEARWRWEGGMGSGLLGLGWLQQGDQPHESLKDAASGRIGFTSSGLTASL